MYDHVKSYNIIKELSAVEEAEARVRRAELLYEKERRLEKTEQTVAAFDEALR
jgi:hypothetical protein